MRNLTICTGNSRHSATWPASTIGFEELYERLKNPLRTGETVAQYQAMTKGERDEAKDKGGFFAGTLKGTRRRKEEVLSRSMITLDADNLKAGVLENLEKLVPYAAIAYTTHSHTPEAPRARILLPLSRDTSPEETVAISRYLCYEMGMEMFDPCSFKVNQLMHWPTCPKDGEYIFRRVVGEWLDPDVFLSDRPGWSNPTNLPRAASEAKELDHQRKHQEDPLSKKGVIGAFCRTYSVEDVMEKFLPDVYAPSAVEGRYDYLPGEGSAGVVIYEGRFAYSHHATDPAGGRLLNAFDLVRIHRFGDGDGSVKAMWVFASNDDEVTETLAKERQQEAEADFACSSASLDGVKWDEPLPLRGEELPPFPVDALPKVLRDYALAVGTSTQTPVDMAAVAVLTVASACMRNNYKVEGKADWHEPTNLYSVIIAEPSERKSAVISLATRPLDEYVRSYNEEHKVDFEMSRAMKKKLENRRDSLISSSRKKGEASAAEDFDDALRDAVQRLVEFREAKPLKVYVDDTTPEKLTETLSENGGAISLISSEGGIFDVLSGAYSSKVNIDVFLKAYSGENISVERIMRQPVVVNEACLTILLSVQPVVIGGLMGNRTFRHRGFTARFLYTHPKSSVGTRSLDSEPLSEAVSSAYKALVWNLLDERNGGGAELIRIDDEARNVLTAYYDWVEKRLTGEFSMYSDWLGKLVGNTLRIAGVIARCSVMKQNVGDALLAEDAPVSICARVMEDAVRIGKYFLVHAVNAYGDMGVRSDFRASLLVLEKIREKNMERVTKRDLMRSCRWIGSAEEAQTILNNLEDFGYVRLASIDVSDKIRGGRPKNAVFAVNPAVFG